MASHGHPIIEETMVPFHKVAWKLLCASQIRTWDGALQVTLKCYSLMSRQRNSFEDSCWKYYSCSGFRHERVEIVGGWFLPLVRSFQFYFNFFGENSLSDETGLLEHQCIRLGNVWFGRRRWKVEFHPTFGLLVVWFGNVPPLTIATFVVGHVGLTAMLYHTAAHIATRTSGARCAPYQWPS